MTTDVSEMHLSEMDPEMLKRFIIICFGLLAERTETPIDVVVEDCYRAFMEDTQDA